MIDTVNVGLTSTLISEGGTNITITGDPNGTVWLAAGVPAEVGKGVRIDLYGPKHTFFGLNGPIYGIAVGSAVGVGVHVG